jgi:signal transduction histidine kinase
VADGELRAPAGSRASVSVPPPAALPAGLGATVSRTVLVREAPRGRAADLDPLTPLWRGAAVFRVLTFVFVVGVQLVYSPDYLRPGLSWVLVGLVAGWTVVTVVAFSVERFRTWPLVAADVVVVLALIASTLLVQTAEQVSGPTPSITTLWSATPVVTAAVLGGARVGTLVGLLVSVMTVLVNGHVTTSIARDTVLLLLTGIVLGLVSDTARRSHAALEQALRAEAVLAERERLARAVHDSVLQVLAYVRREGTVLGGQAAELARLAGDQEVALRALVAAAPAGDLVTGEVDLRVLLQSQAAPRVQVSVPATPVLLAAEVATELAAVARAALTNTAVHAGDEARAWVLLEDLGDQVVLSVRDDGVGIEPGRLDRAEQEGRMGVARSLRGRVADLGGVVVLDTVPGEGTEWEVRVPRAAPDTSRRGRRG